MSVEFHISNQYLRSNRKKGFVSFISGVSMVGLILAVMSLITVLSVMNGFHEELTNRVLNAISHSYITENDNTLENWEELREKINTHDQILASSPYVENFALITSKNSSQGVSVRGIIINLEIKTSALLDEIKYGEIKLTEDSSSVLIGVGLATLLSAGIGDSVTLMAPSRNSIGLLMPKSKTFTVTGIFNAGLNEYNNNLAFIHLNDAQELFSLDNQVSGIRLKVDNLFEANKITNDVVEKLGSDLYYGVDWMQQKRNFIKALNLEKQIKCPICPAETIAESNTKVSKDLKDFIKNKSIKKIDILKIDTEGYDFNVIKSLGDEINNIEYIYFEHHFHDMLVKDYHLSDVHSYLKNFNFNIG